MSGGFDYQAYTASFGSLTSCGLIQKKQTTKMTTDKLNFDEIFSKYRSDPYKHVDIFSVHTGVVKFKVKEGDTVEGVSGEWQHIPGSPLYEINRERNPKVISSKTNGNISWVNTEVDGSFVEAGTKLLTISHPLKKKEVIEAILKDVLYIFRAPERARYFFAMDIKSKIDNKGIKSISIAPGDEIITMSLMKRDTPVYYEGEPGVLHSVYFQPGDSVDNGAPLIGICPEDKVSVIQKIITRVKAEWDAQ